MRAALKIFIGVRINAIGVSTYCPIKSIISLRSCLNIAAAWFRDCQKSYFFERCDQKCLVVYLLERC